MSESKKNLVIYNPRAGKSCRRPKLSAILAMTEGELGETDAVATAYRGHARRIAGKLGDRCENVICCGGDGTLNEVVSGLLSASHEPNIGYIPMGSTNDLAKNIGIPSDAAKVINLIKDGNTNGYDAGRFNGRYFTYFASFCPGVSVSYSTPQKMKNLLGYSAYMINGFLFQVIPTLKEVKPKHIKIEYDGNVLEDDFYFGSVSNTLSAAGIFKFNREDVRFNDGKFEVMLVRRMRHPLQVFSMLHKMRRRDYDGDTLLYFQASHMRFTFSEPAAWTLDGEYSGKVSEVEINVLNNAVSIYCPDSEYFLKDSPSAGGAVKDFSAASQS